MKRLIALTMCVVSLGAAAQLPDYVPTDGLVAWYPFNGNANDESGNGNHGVVNGAVLTEDRFGATDAAYFFNDQSSISSLVTNAAQGDAAATLVGWGYLDLGNTDVSYMVGYGGDPEVDQEGQFFAQGEYGTSGIFATASGSSYDVISDVHCPLNEWFHIASVLSNSEVILYLNGEVIFEKTITQPEIGVSNGCWIGSSAYHGGGVDSFWQGFIDDIGIWNRAITEEEVSALYNATSPNAGCTDVDACNFDDEAVLDDGSCVSCDFIATFCGVGTIWDSATQTCIGDGSGDINLDGCVQLNDLLDLLSAYGDCGAEELGWQCGDLLEYQDYDYETVQIGEQCWFAENLRAENYRNEEAIPTELSDSEWAGTAEGAVSVYDGDMSNLSTYGRLYNWYAVDDDRSLCPIGWHAATDSDWTSVVDLLGGDSSSGIALKSQQGWNNNGDGNDSVGFSALPGGVRAETGVYLNKGAGGYWWTSSPSNSTAYSRDMQFDENYCSRGDDYSLNAGFSIRCIKDTE